MLPSANCVQFYVLASRVPHRAEILMRSLLATEEAINGGHGRRALHARRRAAKGEGGNRGERIWARRRALRPYGPQPHRRSHPDARGGRAGGKGGGVRTAPLRGRAAGTGRRRGERRRA